MQEIQEDFYSILGVEEKATPDDIRKAYLKLAKKLHPDRFPNDPERKSAAQAEFARVTRAHEVLADPKQRDEYDAIRTLTRSRMALETGTGGAGGVAVGTTSDPAVSQTITGTGQFKAESKVEWAAKHSARADDCYKRKKFQEAETAIKEAIRLAPESAKYHCQLAEIYLARGWKTLAQTEVQTALRLDPKDDGARGLEAKLKSASSKAAAQSKKDAGGGGLFGLFRKK